VGVCVCVWATLPGLNKMEWNGMEDWTSTGDTTALLWSRACLHGDNKPTGHSGLTSKAEEEGFKVAPMRWTTD